MASYSWPLNVRELDNTVRMLEVIGRGELVTPEMLPENLRLRRPGFWASSPAENQLITTLKKNSGNIRRTSQELGVSRTYIYRQLDRCGIDPTTLRSGAALA